MDNSETTATSDTRHRTMTNQNTTQKTKMMGNTDPTTAVNVILNNTFEESSIYRNYKSLTKDSQN